MSASAERDGVARPGDVDDLQPCPAWRRDLDADARLTGDRADREAAVAERIRSGADGRPAGIRHARHPVADDVVAVAVEAQRGDRRGMAAGARSAVSTAAAASAERMPAS